MGEAPHLGNNGQLSRDERVQLYGIDCEDQALQGPSSGWEGVLDEACQDNSYYDSAM